MPTRTAAENGPLIATPASSMSLGKEGSVADQYKVEDAATLNVPHWESHSAESRVSVHDRFGVGSEDRTRNAQRTVRSTDWFDGLYYLWRWSHGGKKEKKEQSGSTHYSLPWARSLTNFATKKLIIGLRYTILPYHWCLQINLRDSSGSTLLVCNSWASVIQDECFLCL